jgi:hypothetical protein
MAKSSSLDPMRRRGFYVNCFRLRMIDTSLCLFRAIGDEARGSVEGLAVQGPFTP